MKNFIKLLNFELNRFMKLYVILFIITIISQLGGAFFTIQHYLSRAKDAVFNSGMTEEAFVYQNGKMNMFNILYSYSFLIPIAIGATALLFYMFFIWYRDWFAKNTFIYRLLMLPTARMNLFLSKLATIMITVFGLISLQIILLYIQSSMIRVMVPQVYREDIFIRDVTANFSYLSVLIPNTFFEFLIAYGLGLLFVVVIFTAILFERSFRIKGIIFGVLYCLFSLILFLTPFIIEGFIGESYLYPSERFAIGLLMWAIICAVSILVSRHLLNKKVTV